MTLGIFVDLLQVLLSIRICILYEFLLYFFCIDGSIALLSSSLTGQIWDGLIWVFSNYSELNDVAKETMSILGYAMPSGGSDVVWINDDTIATANDNGEVGFNDLRKLLFCNVMLLFLKVVQK